jgi:hypothetical protein
MELTEKKTVPLDDLLPRCTSYESLKVTFLITLTANMTTTAGVSVQQ